MMGFSSDLEQIIRRQFEKHGIKYETSMCVSDLAARYFEMANRRISLDPRHVHFSDQIHDSLGALRRTADTREDREAADAWSAVFQIRYLMVRGRNVNSFLTRRINVATGKESRDGMLWDFGMHHFHLSTEFKDSGLARRSGYLLFAIVTDEDAYFVDVGPHPKRGESVEWARQRLLRVVQSNWPDLVDSRILRGARGDVLTDEERAELRRKNVNVVTDLGDDGVAPLGGGVACDGSSIWCRWMADKLMDDIECHERFFDAQSLSLRAALKAKAIAVPEEIKLELVLLEELRLPDQQIRELSADHCLSKNLCQMGFVVVERTTRCPIVVTLERDDCQGSHG